MLEWCSFDDWKHLKIDHSHGISSRLQRLIEVGNRPYDYIPPGFGGSD